jgi:hypothetical protein
VLSSCVCTCDSPLQGKGKIAYIMLFDTNAGACHSRSPKNRNEKEVFYNSGKSEVGIVVTYSSLFDVTNNV